MVKLIAHRGLSKYYPENTLLAYKEASNKGFKYVECDISFTKDKVPVLLHDDSIDRTSNVKGKINKLLYNDILKYDFGNNEKIPLFYDFLKLCKELNLIPYIELKPIKNKRLIKEYVNILINNVKELDMDNNIVWISFSIDFLKEINKYSKARLGLIINKFNIKRKIAKTFLKLRNDRETLFIDHYYGKINNRIVNDCINNNLKLEVWTVNNMDEYKKLNSYISGITCNYNFMEE